MKRILLFLLLITTVFTSQAQVPISALPSASGDLRNAVVPVVTGGVTRKATAQQLNLMDSLIIRNGTYYDSIFVMKDGVRKYSLLVRSGLGTGGGGSFDTTAIYEAIALKLSESDTSAMLDPYLREDVAAATYQPKLTLTTTGTSGASTLVGSTLNIPQYSGGGSLPASYDSMYRAFYNAFSGDTSIVIIAGTVRNSCGSGSAIMWQLVSVTNGVDHESLYLSTDVDSSSDGFRVKFPAGYKCITFLAAPDETLALRGYQCGSSFSTSYADVRITKLINQSSAIWGNGTANSIDQYGSTIYGGTTYTDATGQFVTTVRNQGYQPNYAVSITSANPLYYPVIDGNASYAQTTVVKWNLYKYSDGTKLTGTLSYGSYANISAAPYWTTEVCNTTVGSEIGCGGNSNVWIIGLLKKN